MKFKLFTLTLVSLISAAECFSLTYTVGQNTKEKDFKYSTAEFKDWNSTKAYVSKPATNDTIQVYYGKNLTIDADINVAKLNVLGGSSAEFFNRQNIRTNSIDFNVGGSGSKTSIIMKKSKFTTGGVSASCYPNSTTLGRASFNLEDSVLIIRRNLSTQFPTNANSGFFNNKGKRGGIEFILKGKTYTAIEGGIVHDTQIITNPKEFIFNIKLEEKNGNIPLMHFGKAAIPEVMDVDIQIKSLLKKGRYTLIEFENKKDKPNFRNLSFNGQPFNLGDSIEANGQTIKIYAGKTRSNTAKEKSKDNDLLIEVK